MDHERENEYRTLEILMHGNGLQEIALPQLSRLQRSKGGETQKRRIWALVISFAVNASPQRTRKGPSLYDPFLLLLFH